MLHKKKSIKVIFLDIDGVLVDGDSFRPGMTKATIMSKHLPILKEIVNQTKASIVLSSTWRSFPDSVKYLNHLFKLYGLKISDMTGSHEYCRELEIMEYLYKHKKIQRYLVLDDEYETCFSVLKRGINIDYHVGLLKDHIEQCVDILNNMPIIDRSKG